MISIVYIVSTLEKSGPINQLYNLIFNLDREKFKPQIITLSKEAKNSRYEDFKVPNINIHSLELSRLRFLFNGKDKLLKMLESLKPDIIHTSGYRADVTAVRYLSKFKHCNTIHNFAFEDYIMTYGKLIGKAMAHNHIKEISKMTYPIACSSSIAKKLKQCCSVDTYAISNGVDDKFFSPASENEKVQLRQKLGLSISKKIFIFAGVMSSRKDPITVIEAFKKSEISNSAELVLLGDGPLMKTCKKYKYENVIFKGCVKNVVEFLKCADVFISASHSEGLPMAVLEAINCGLPVILSDIESHREILSYDCQIGDKFTVGNVDELRDIIDSYCSIKLDNKSKAARKVGQVYYSSRIMCDRYENMYSYIMDKARREK